MGFSLYDVWIVKYAHVLCRNDHFYSRDKKEIAMAEFLW